MQRLMSLTVPLVTCHWLPCLDTECHKQDLQLLAMASNYSFQARLFSILLWDMKDIYSIIHFRGGAVFMWRGYWMIWEPTRGHKSRWNHSSKPGPRVVIRNKETQIMYKTYLADKLVPQEVQDTCCLLGSHVGCGRVVVDPCQLRDVVRVGFKENLFRKV